ncbi:hypothetical protein [Bacillus glycinifermentans]|uniref:hypothetical protein n=1 Tax=Bacillus glycinifermentans TaxID=1664069 RepID=UPI000815110E|nr:hypothetical protein [Bacillus glycinifermentans]SCA85850.1 hypothetical protein BGLY_2027 [Bacillus glycinifermentans]
MSGFKYAVFDTVWNEMEFYKDEEAAERDYERGKKAVSERNTGEPEIIYLLEIVKKEEVK